MATSYPISAPPIQALSERIQLVYNQSPMRSPFSGHTQIINNYAEWEVELSFPAQRRGSQAVRNFTAWLDQLNGIIGTFVYTPHNASKPIVAALQTKGFAYSTEINLTGWSANAPTLIAAGDYFTLGGQMHRLTAAPASANGAGHATVSFVPPLRADRNAGMGANFANPAVTLRLTDPESSGSIVTTDVQASYLQTIVAREAI